VFKSPFPWVAVLLLSITPAWFLHSRTAFETALATTFFAVFIYFYLMYRNVSPRYLYAAVVAGALCFYSYSPAQMVMAVAAVLLLISDAPYHWKNRLTVLKGLELTLVLALPYARFPYPAMEMRMSSTWTSCNLIGYPISPWAQSLVIFSASILMA